MITTGIKSKITTVEKDTIQINNQADDKNWFYLLKGERDMVENGLGCYVSDEDLKELADDIYRYLRIKNIAIDNFYDEDCGY